MAVRDDAVALAGALASVETQDHAGAVEIVVADGSESPETGAVVRALFPRARLLANPARSTSAGLNRAVAAAAHPIVVRCDARALLPPDYVRLAVAALERTGAAVVGGTQRPVGSTPLARAVAHAMTTPLGAGDARYRLGGPEGPADTVWLGVFRRDALEAAGGFDETLARNQDYELNWRLRARGETVWFDPALRATYRPRGSLGALARQYFAYGWWKRVVLARHPGSARWRQRAAPALVAGLAGSAALGAAAGAPALRGRARARLRASSSPRRRRCWRCAAARPPRCSCRPSSPPCTSPGARDTGAPGRRAGAEGGSLRGGA